MLDDFIYDPHTDRPAELRRQAERHRLGTGRTVAAPGRRTRFGIRSRRR